MVQKVFGLCVAPLGAKIDEPLPIRKDGHEGPMEDGIRESTSQKQERSWTGMLND